MPTKKSTKKTASTKKTTKKTVKKAAKKTTKQSSKKSAAKKPLVCAPDEHCFWVVNGVILRDLKELKEAFETMEDSVYGHHVSNNNNDFANWVEHVLEDAACANDLRKTKKPNTAKTVVVRHLRFYNPM